MQYSDNAASISGLRIGGTSSLQFSGIFWSRIRDSSVVESRPFLQILSHRWAYSACTFFPKMPTSGGALPRICKSSSSISISESNLRSLISVLLALDFVDPAITSLGDGKSLNTERRTEIGLDNTLARDTLEAVDTDECLFDPRFPTAEVNRVVLVGNAVTTLVSFEKESFSSELLTDFVTEA